jgi:hypothetical protein
MTKVVDGCKVKEEDAAGVRGYTTSKHSGWAAKGNEWPGQGGGSARELDVRFLATSG